MKVYVVQEIIDLGDHVVSVHKNQVQAILEVEALNVEFRRIFPSEHRSLPYFYEEYELQEYLNG